MERKEPHPFRTAAALWPALLIAMLDQCALLIAIPVLPVAFLEMGYSPAEAATYAGAAVSLFAASQLMGSPFSGRLSDKFPRYKVLAGCGLISSAGLILCCLAPAASFVLAGRVVCGLGGGSRGVLAAIVSDEADQSYRHIAFSKLNACTSAAYIVAPAVGGVLSFVSWRLPFAVAGTLAFMSAVVCWLSSTRSNSSESCRGVSPGARERRTGGSSRTSIVLISFFCSFANVAFPTTLAIANTVRYGWTALEVGSLFTLLGLCGLAAQLWVLPVLSRRFDPRQVLSVALASGLIGITIYAVSPTTGWFYSAVPLMAVLMLAPSSILALLSTTATQEAQGSTQALITMSSASASLLGPSLFSSLLAWQLSIDPDLSVLPVLPFALSGLCLILAVTVHATTSAIRSR